MRPHGLPITHLIHLGYTHTVLVCRYKDGAWYAFYECSSSVKRGNLCTPHYTRQDKLEADVLAAIQLQVKAALNYDKLLAKLRNSEGERSIRDQQNALITSLNLKLSGISKKRTRLYEDFTEGILDEEEYSNIGINKIDSMLRSPNCPFVLFVGTKKLVKRKEFEQFISEKLVI